MTLYGWEDIVELALREDVGTGDVTTEATVDADRIATAEFLVKQPGVISGLDVARYVFQRVDDSIQFSELVGNGSPVQAGDVIGTVSGSARSILIAERTALNILQRLSGIATLTSRYVRELTGSRTVIVDTRKTGPGMRLLEKRAVADGGGRNHRFGLFDGVLIKDNHLAAVGTENRITRAIELARTKAPHTVKIEVEVTTLDELREALAANADIVMLDNMSDEAMQDAVQIRNDAGSRTLLEASGNVTLDRLGEIAATGVDLISSGALTHSAPALDISLNFRLV